MKKKFDCFFCLIFGLLALFSGQVFAENVTEQVRPNIVFILTDDQGYGDMGCHGHPFLETPNMDRLHAESVRLTDFSVSPTCSPTRASIMTGMQEFNSGVSHTVRNRNLPDLHLKLLPEILRSAGYATGQFGKWHLGKEGEFRPENRGFDVALVAKKDSQDSHFNPTVERNGVPETIEGFRTDIFFDEAISWIGKQKESGKPFFCYLATYSPHTPLKVPANYTEPYLEKTREEDTPYFGMVANIDENLGKMLAFLKEEGLEENTLLVFMSDNGGTKGVDDYNAGMKGCKATIWRGGTRTFSFWRWKGTWDPRDDDAMTGHVDILPTLVSVTGAEVPEAQQARLEGQSLAARLQDASTELADRMLFQHVSRWGSGFVDKHKYLCAGVRWNRWSLLQSGTCDLGAACEGECRIHHKAAAGAEMLYTDHPEKFYITTTPVGEWMLYDLEADPGQEQNVSNEHPEVAEKMAAAYEAWWEKVRPHLKE